MGSRRHVALAARVAVEEAAATVEAEAVEEAVEEAVAEEEGEEKAAAATRAARGGARSWQKVAAAGCVMMVAPRSSLRPGIRRPLGSCGGRGSLRLRRCDALCGRTPRRVALCRGLSLAARRDAFIRGALAAVAAADGLCGRRLKLERMRAALDSSHRAAPPQPPSSHSAVRPGEAQSEATITRPRESAARASAASAWGRPLAPKGVGLAAALLLKKGTTRPHCERLTESSPG